MIYLYISMITRFSIIICRWQLTSPNVEAKLSTDKLMSPTKPRFQQRQEIENKKPGRKTREKIKTRDLLFLNKDFLARWLLSGHGWKRKLARQLFWWISNTNNSNKTPPIIKKTTRWTMPEPITGRWTLPMSPPTSGSLSSISTSKPDCTWSSISHIVHHF